MKLESEESKVIKMLLTDLIAKFQINLLIGFGSYQTERFTHDSDIDLAYQSDRCLSPNEEMELLSGFVFLYKKDRIDLVDLKKASPLLMFEIASNGNVLFETDESFLRFKLKASARYAETRFLRKMRRDFLNSQLGQSTSEVQ